MNADDKKRFLCIDEKLARIHVLIEGDPKENFKGVFQRLDDANGKLLRHEKWFNRIWGGCGTVAVAVIIFIIQNNLTR